jgi:hypothetical protein
LLFVLAVFAVLAVVVYVNNGNPEVRRINLVAQQYADAWHAGQLAGLDYDALSSPDVDGGDPQKVADNVKWITYDLDGAGTLAPVSVTVDKGATRRSAEDPRLATTQLWVTWKLQPAGLSQQGHLWTYPVTLQVRQAGGRWRVVWTPQTVHPAIRHGLVFRVQRTLAPRANLLGAGDTVLPPSGSPNLAHAVLGTVISGANHEQSELADLRAKDGDTIGLAGLQDLYDARLAGGAQLQVTADVVPGYTRIPATQQPLFVGPPTTPRPIKLTLDARTQGWAENALRGITTPATLVVVKPSTGELIAAANTSGDVDYALSAQQPPGSVFGLTSFLALMRAGYTTTNRVDCQEPWTFPQAGQVFRNTQGPVINNVTLGAAVEGGCTTALARLTDPAITDHVTNDQLKQAAYDLGIAAPLQDPPAGTPGWVAVADQLGTPAFHGRVNADAQNDALKDNQPVHLAENISGGGTVLVSPLSMTRATATVASGTRRAVKLIVDPAPGHADQEKQLSPAELQALQEIMTRGVSEAGGSAHTLAGLPGTPVSALAGIATYGTGNASKVQSWCTGYRGDYAFTVLVSNVAATGNATTQLQPAFTVARNFLAAAG